MNTAVLIITIYAVGYASGFILGKTGRVCDPKIKMNGMYSMTPERLGESSRKVAKLLLPAIVTIFGVPMASLGAGVAKNNVDAGLKYLEEPTKEFKEEEALTSAFRADQTRRRKLWDNIIEKFQNSEDHDSTLQALRDMKGYLNQNNGVPPGVKKRDIVKICREKKFNGRKIKPSWTTDIEISYNEFIAAYNRLQFPNDKVTNVYILNS